MPDTSPVNPSVSKRLGKRSHQVVALTALTVLLGFLFVLLGERSFFRADTIEFPPFSAPDNFLYQCPAPIVNDRDQEESTFLDSLRDFCGGKLFFKPAWAASDATLRKLVDRLSVVGSDSRMVNWTPLISQQGWWDLPYLVLAKQVPVSGSHWWFCHWNGVFPISDQIFLLPVCGVRSAAPADESFLRVYALNVDGKLLRDEPVLSRTWERSKGLALGAVFPFQGRALFAVQDFQVGSEDLRTLRSTAFAFHGLNPREVVVMDMHYQERDHTECSGIDIRGCWAFRRVWSPPWQDRFVPADDTSRAEVVWALWQGDRLEKSGVINLRVDQRRWRLTDHEGQGLFSDTSLLPLDRFVFPDADAPE